MLKYTNTGIVFQEIPDEVTLAINISNCPCHCPGCHSQYLWEDIGLPLDTTALDDFIDEYGRDITCIAFMGGDYIKIGPFIRHLGPLKSPTTNQRLYRILPDGTQLDITSRFWHITT